jgi:hypothetical protein
VEVAIQLGLSEKKATLYYREYWMLQRLLYKLYFIYKELKGDLFPLFSSLSLATVMYLLSKVILLDAH